MDAIETTLKLRDGLSEEKRGLLIELVGKIRREERERAAIIAENFWCGIPKEQELSKVAARMLGPMMAQDIRKL
jgi:hypothetical protein